MFRFLCSFPLFGSAAASPQKRAEGSPTPPEDPLPPPLDFRQPLQRFLHLTFVKQQTVARNGASPKKSHQNIFFWASGAVREGPRATREGRGPKRGAGGGSNGPQRGPKGPKLSQNGAPKWAPKGPNGTQRVPKWTPQRLKKTNELPDGPPKGRGRRRRRRRREYEEEWE